MILETNTTHRTLKHISVQTELVITGGGLAGVCMAITAARLGTRVVLIQDRPVLGGNSSSEVRLWILGATSHMGNNNRWAREGGVIDEILVENMFRNKEGNPVLFDTILLEKVVEEPKIQLFLNTAVYEVQKKTDTEIQSITAFCAQNSTRYSFEAPLFADASGDGIVGFLSGAAFRMGAESMEEFGEKFAPSKAYGELLGHTLYFYSKDVGRPTKFVAPSFALKNIENAIPRYRNFTARDFGCRLWWIEYGGRLDTVHDTETIKWELWKVVYGVWDYIKNSGKFPDAENLTLEWVGTIPGKRESRRFEGDTMIRQQDVIEQTAFPDAVAFGGWSIDLHPADGVFSEKPGCNQWHSKGIYPIPYRSLYSRNIHNLFIAGRLISASHVAFGSTRVMATAAHGGQAIGAAAHACIRNQRLPKELLAPERLDDLQQTLLKMGQHIPGIKGKGLSNLAWQATLSASSSLQLEALPPDGKYEVLDFPVAQMLPAQPGPFPSITFYYEAAEDTRLDTEFRISSKPFNHTPDVSLEKKPVLLAKGKGLFTLEFQSPVPQEQYVFVCLMKNDQVRICRSEKRITGILSVFNRFNKAVSNHGKQEPTEDIGVESFEFWVPMRRPEGQNLAFRLASPLPCFEPENLKSGYQRPVSSTHAWVSDEEKPTLSLKWNAPQTIRTITLYLDTDFDHPAESTLMGHPEDVMPFVVRKFLVKNEKGELLAQTENNHQTICRVALPKPMTLSELQFEFSQPMPTVPVAVFEIRVE